MGTNANGVINIYNGTVTNNATANDTALALTANDNSQGALNLLGSGAMLNATGSAMRGHQSRRNAAAIPPRSSISTAAWLLTNYVKAGGNSTPTYLGFNGGTLRANSNNAAFISGLTAAMLYSSGGTIDTNGYSVTSSNGLLAPTGSGLTSIALATSGAGYIGDPAVRITGGGGQGARPSPRST